MLQNPCKTLGFKKNMVYKIPPGGGEVNHIQPVAYIICKLATGKILFFLLVSVAEETGLKLVLSETPKTGFLTARPSNSLLIV